MKKLSLTLMATLASATLAALPLGNPTEASFYTDGIFFSNCNEGCSIWDDAFSFRVGFYGDYVRNRHLEVKTNRSNIHQAKIQTEAGYFALNFCRRIDLFGTLGVTHFEIQGNPRNFGNFNLTNQNVFVETDANFSWSLGGRGTLWECGCLGLGVEAQYFNSRNHVNFARRDLANIGYQPTNVIFKYHEWQVGLGLSYRINIICEGTALIPYTGVKWARARVDMDNFIFQTGGGIPLFDLKNQREWGFVVGVTLLGCNKISIGAEARFADEQAYYVNSQFRF